MRAGVVGLSHYHVTGWVETLETVADELEIVALCDADPERARTLAPAHVDPTLRPALDDRYRRLPVEGSVADLIARHDLDVALVTLPDAEAPAACVELAAAGIHLLVDKPGARTEAEAATAARAIREAGVRSVVGLTRRYLPAYRRARELVASGRLGRLVAAQAAFVTSSVAVRDPTNRLFDPASSGGGILSWLGIHDIDTLLWLTGEPITEVHAMTASIGVPDLGVEDVVSVAVRFGGGGIGTLAHAYVLPAPGYRGGVALHGLDASIELGSDQDLVVVERDGDGRLREDRRPFPVPPVPGYGAAGREAVLDLLGAILEGRETEAPYETLVRSHRVIDAAYASARTGRRMTLVAR